MGKIIVVEFISLDGVMQAPGGQKEDTSNNFQYGGWSAPFADELSGKGMQKQMAPADLLLGRKTFDIFSRYWPEHADYWPGINDVTKYVLSNTLTSSDWKNTVFLKNVDDIRRVKNASNSEIKVWGSAELVHLLLEHDLVDELWLKIYPVILGNGKKIFDGHETPTSFELAESTLTPKGIIFASYKRVGEVKTGTMGA